MKRKLLHEEAGRKTIALAFARGEEVAATLLWFAQETGIRAASLQAIGGFRAAMLGYFDRRLREYRRIPVREQVELLSLVGTLSEVRGGARKLHAHAVLGKADGSAMGGHLIEGQVWPTLEMILVVYPSVLERALDAETNLPLLDLPE